MSTPNIRLCVVTILRCIIFDAPVNSIPLENRVVNIFLYPLYTYQNL